MNSEEQSTNEDGGGTIEKMMTSSGEDALYELLFSDVSDEKERPSADETYQYLQELNSYHLDRLAAEPFILREKQALCGEEIKSLAFSNYKTFVRTAHCSREIYADFARIDEHLDEVLGRLPTFSQACDSFTKSIQVINQQRRGNTLTLQKHTQLLEFLEISQLMDTCVRNEYYEEALDLAAYVKRLDKKYGQSIALVKQQIVQDVNKSLDLMLRQLLQQLKTNLQFNQCLKVIGLIRRLDVYGETELRIKFLELRDSWLKSLLDNIPQQDPYAHITKTIEENRVHLFDIITQYRAIFSDDDTNISLTSRSSSDSNKFGPLNNSKLFYVWLFYKIDNFLNVLTNDLKLGVGNRIDSVLSQSMYFGLAFSRVGLDFRALLIPIFEKTIHEQFARAVKQANAKFVESLARLNWSELVADAQHTATISSSSRQDSSTFFQSTAKSSNLIVNPPLVVMDYLPLAIYLNILIQAFNDLRLCAPLSLHVKILGEVHESIRDMALHLRDYHRKEKLDKAESELFAQMLSILATQMIPFIERCVLIIYPLDQLQKAYGLSQSDAAKMKEIMRVDYKVLLEPVIDLLPQQQQLVASSIEESKIVDSLKQTSSSDIGIASIKEEEVEEEVTTEPAKFEIGEVQQEFQEQVKVDEATTNKEEDVNTNVDSNIDNKNEEEKQILTEDAKID